MTASDDNSLAEVTLNAMIAVLTIPFAVVTRRAASSVVVKGLIKQDYPFSFALHSLKKLLLSAFSVLLNLHSRLTGRNVSQKPSQILPPDNKPMPLRDLDEKATGVRHRLI